MKNSLFLLFILIVLMSTPLRSQSLIVDEKHFFIETELIDIELKTNLKHLLKEKEKKELDVSYQPATISFIFPDSMQVTETIEIKPRGKYRRLECYLPPLMVNFKTPSSTSLRKLDRLKMVLPCSTRPFDQQLVLKEYLVYRIFNLLTEKSFRVRLVRLHYFDDQEKIKPEMVYAFFIEDVDDVARRNNCVEIDNIIFNTESTDRKQMTLVALFQYMIGNTDWAVPIYQNIKLIQDKNNKGAAPYPIPYDFDYSGLVNAKYAIPAEELPIKTVRDRLYLGFPRTIEELDEALSAFTKIKQPIDSLIMSCKGLEVLHQEEMIDYIEEFYEIARNQRSIQRIFIRNAKRQ